MKTAEIAQNSLFPERKDIPEQFALKSPVIIDRYLIGGSLRPWNGSFRDAFSPVSIRTVSGINPYVMGRYPLLTEKEALEALHTAHNAFKYGSGSWPQLSARDRVRSFLTFLSAMKEKREEISNLLMWEIGKPYEDALKEFDRAVTYTEDTIHALEDLESNTGRIRREQGMVGKQKRVPFGVALCLSPLNYPLYETFTAIAPALLMGNTVVLKPPRFGSLLFRPLLPLFRDYFPEGVVNIIFGNGRKIIPGLMSSGMVDILAFIGTSKTADHLKRLHPKQHRLQSILGLEAKNPAIILPDADMDLTVKESLMGAFAFNGQRCAALKIFFVHRKIAKNFVRKFAEETARLKRGMPWEKGVMITPLMEPTRVTYLEGLVQDALSQGARIATDQKYGNEGSLFHPAVLYPVTSQMKIYHEEQFGPVVPVVSFDDMEVPLRYVTESPYGQQVSLFGADPNELARLASVLTHHVSRININCKCQRTPDTFPFAGRKDSGESVLSVSDALYAFTTQSFVVARDEGKNDETLDHI